MVKEKGKSVFTIDSDMKIETPCHIEHLALES